MNSSPIISTLERYGCQLICRGYFVLVLTSILQFVREFVTDLVDCAKEADLPDSSTSSPFLVRNTDHEGNDQWQLFIDSGVYTRNRMFRVLGSSKFHKEAILQMHPSSIAVEKLDFDTFASTLVCPYPSVYELNAEALNIRLLRCPDVAPPAILRLGRSSMSASARVSSSRAVECRQSLWPELDSFIRSVAINGGIQGEIRAVQMLYSPVLDSEAGSEFRPWMITFHMMRNRWCSNIRRAHRSNNVMFIVDIASRVYYQKCHDPMCQAVDYRYATSIRTPFTWRVARLTHCNTRRYVYAPVPN